MMYLDIPGGIRTYCTWQSHLKKNIRTTTYIYLLSASSLLCLYLYGCLFMMDYCQNKNQQLILNFICNKAESCKKKNTAACLTFNVDCACAWHRDASSVLGLTVKLYTVIHTWLSKWETHHCCQVLNISKYVCILNGWNIMKHVKNMTHSSCLNSSYDQGNDSCGIVIHNDRAICPL